MIARFVRGMGYFGRGWRLAFGTPALVRWVLMPALLTAAISIGGTLLAYRWAANFVARHAAGHNALWGAVVWLGVMVLVLGSAYVLYVASCLLSTAPFAGVLSEGAERVSVGEAVRPHGWRAAAALAGRGVGHTLLTVSCYVGIAIPLFLLQWFAPPLAPLVWVASLLQAALFFAFDAFNEPLHRRAARFGDKWSFIGTHLAEALGFGLAVALLMMVPFLSVLVTPVAIVGGTLLYLDLERGPTTTRTATPTK